MSDDPAQEFYDPLAPYYHLIYPDWQAAIGRQGAALDALIGEHAPDAKTVLDLSCGIGTQSLGLAERGYSVSASDISEESCRRASVLSEKSVTYCCVQNGPPLRREEEAYP